MTRTWSWLDRLLRPGPILEGTRHSVLISFAESSGIGVRTREESCRFCGRSIKIGVPHTCATETSPR